MKEKKLLFCRSVSLFSGVILWIAMLLVSCDKPKPLPILGNRYYENGDTVFHQIGHFQFVDQDSAIITNENLDGKIYVADFFFTSCRTICPIMKTQMLRVYEATREMNDVLLVSHTIDPEYDTIALLLDYAERLGVKSDRWHFLTGQKDSIYKVAQTSYFATAMEDKSEPDGFIHSGAFLLVDKKGRIRGKYDGTKEMDVNRLIADIKRLRTLDEM
jgi:protein SCO1/2